jgi:transketolase N-terminal domain/subunit
MSFEAAVNRKAIEIGKLAIEMTTAAGSGHPSTALSLAHLVTVLMYHQMRWDPKDPWNGASDRLVLSEGHAVPIVYAALADLGGYYSAGQGREGPADDDRRCDVAARDRQPDRRASQSAGGISFADAATGSLGQGLSVAAGLASAARMDKLDRNFTCIIGDGESREGQNWEAADFVVDHALTNVVPIFNCNELAQSDWVSPQQSYEGLAAKLKAYGFHRPRDRRARSAGDQEALNELPVVQNGHRPLAIVARTIKGWGARPSRGWASMARRSRRTSLPDPWGAGSRPPRSGRGGLQANGELKISLPRPRSPPREKKPIKAASFARGAGHGGLGQGFGRRQADRDAPGVWGGAGGAGRGGQARGGAGRGREELHASPSGSPTNSRRNIRVQDRRAEHDQRRGRVCRRRGRFPSARRSPSS